MKRNEFELESKSTKFHSIIIIKKKKFLTTKNVLYFMNFSLADINKIEQ